MSWLALPDLLLVLSLGAALGFFGGLFGIGGGIIAVPLFIIGFGMDQALAQGTALVLMVPNLLIGWWRYNQHHKLPWLAVAAIGITATATTWLTAKLAVRLDQDILHWIFNLFILVVGLRMLLLRKTLAPIQTTAISPAQPPCPSLVYWVAPAWACWAWGAAWWPRPC